jgi:hypothetical protein
MDTQRIDHYWRQRFGLEPQMLDQTGIQVVPHARAWKDSLAFVFVRGRTCVLSVGAGFVDATRERACKWVPNSLLSESNLREVFERPIHHIVGPMYQGYAEKQDFLPRSIEMVRILSGEQHEAVQELAWESNRA